MISKIADTDAEKPNIKSTGVSDSVTPADAGVTLWNFSAGA